MPCASQLAQEVRPAALASLVGEYEMAHGEIRVEELRLAGRRASASAIPGHGRTATPGRKGEPP